MPPTSLAPIRLARGRLTAPAKDSASSDPATMIPAPVCDTSPANEINWTRPGDGPRAVEPLLALTGCCKVRVWRSPGLICWIPRNKSPPFVVTPERLGRVSDPADTASGPATIRLASKLRQRRPAADRATEGNRPARAHRQGRTAVD